MNPFASGEDIWALPQYIDLVFSLKMRLLEEKEAAIKLILSASRRSKSCFGSRGDVCAC